MTNIMQFLEEIHLGTSLQAILLIALGYFLARLFSSSLTRAFRRRLTRQQAMLLRRFTFYIILALFVASAIQQLGFRITALLGATGILTIAIGIASQTSFSNIISGIFIIGEKPFEMGDTIKVKDIEGEVIAIDLLSVKIRTNDNMMVRLPNETLVKSAITNISYFPKRRIDLVFNIAYQENLEQLRNLLFEIAEKNSLSLKDPKPSILVQGFCDSGVNIRFSVWATRESFNDVKNSIQEDIINALSNAGIELSFPSRSLYIKKDALQRME
jgi:small-conductance mechanosensitive channel